MFEMKIPLKCTDLHQINNSCIWVTATGTGTKFRPVWRNGWVFVYELSVCGFDSSCRHLNFKFRACFEQGGPWHSGNYRVWIHSESVRDMIRIYSLVSEIPYLINEENADISSRQEKKILVLINFFNLSVITSLSSS